MGCASSHTATASARHTLQSRQKQQEKQQKSSSSGQESKIQTPTTANANLQTSNINNNNNPKSSESTTATAPSTPTAAPKTQFQTSDRDQTTGSDNNSNPEELNEGQVKATNGTNNYDSKTATTNNNNDTGHPTRSPRGGEADSMTQEQTNEYEEQSSVSPSEHEQTEPVEDRTTSKEQPDAGMEQQQSAWDVDINVDLLNEYIQLDYEISELESRDVLHLYHDRIEQLEQLDQELDLTSRDAEEVAKLARQSAASSSVTEEAGTRSGSFRRPSKATKESNTSKTKEPNQPNIEEIFAKKILLEKERDKLKQEVEKVILECDRLQRRYKKRDEILDKIFDGHFGSGLENHLEKQLDWLLEQKHYVDQVFYAWKRAETLATQACEQFNRALEEFRKIERNNLDKAQLDEVARGIYELCIKSRSDMERAQKYNPNVDAPFYADDGRDNFDSVIEGIVAGEWNQFKKNKIKTTIEVAYKRALSIRQWLGQILQTTIARDSFELAEEYRWIAIQLRKERINLIKARIQESPMTSMASSTSQTMPNSSEVNRDSGVDSENNDLELEEEIDRLLKKDRANRQQQQQQQSGQDRLTAPPTYSGFASDGAGSVREGPTSGLLGEARAANAALENINQAAARLSNSGYERPGPGTTTEGSKAGSIRSVGSSFRTLPSVPMDEEAKKNMIAQIDKMHEEHRRQLERHQKRNKAMISSALASRIQRRHGLRKEATGSELARQPA